MQYWHRPSSMCSKIIKIAGYGWCFPRAFRGTKKCNIICT